MNDTTRDAFDRHCKSQNPAYKPTDDGMSNRRDWAIWQAATEQAQRQPLTVVEIKDLWDAQLFNIVDFQLARDFVRDVEEAHGINGESK